MRYRGWTMSAALEKLQKITALDPRIMMWQKIELVKLTGPGRQVHESAAVLLSNTSGRSDSGPRGIQAQSPDFRTEDIKQPVLAIFVKVSI